MRDVIDSAIDLLRKKDLARENLIKMSRELTRISRSIIVSVHNGGDIKELSNQARMMVNEILSLLKDYPDLIDSVRGSLQEYSEAFIFNTILHENRLISFTELNIDPASYLLGVSDALGELRREVIKNVDQWKLEEASRILELMKNINNELSKWNLPDAIAPGLRHKVDVNRHLIEDLEVMISEAKRAHDLIQYMSRLLAYFEKR
ncbi:MAG: hypothetical protein ACP5IZ_07510 [Thermoprotei archaeon]